MVFGSLHVVFLDFMGRVLWTGWLCRFPFLGVLSMAAISCGDLSLELFSFKCLACVGFKRPQRGPKLLSFRTEQLNGGVDVHSKFRRCMPVRADEEQCQNFRISGFGKEAVENWDGTLTLPTFLNELWMKEGILDIHAAYLHSRALPAASIRICYSRIAG